MAPHILLIDDDLLVVKTVARYLKACGYIVEVAESGLEALKKAEELNFDLIISDVRMPGVDGIETLQKIREINKQKSAPPTPEIVITGFADAEAIAKAQNMGIKDYIYKPFDINEFISAVRKYCLL